MAGEYSQIDVLWVIRLTFQLSLGPLCFIKSFETCHFQTLSTLLSGYAMSEPLVYGVLIGQIATTFLGVHLLTSYSQEEPEGSHDDGESNSPSHPPAPQRATSSASLNLLLPTTSRLSERTPLLIPVAVSPESANLPALGGSGSYKGRLLKRTSTGDFTPHLGLSSQAGFLLMATTPPNIPPGLLSNRRERSSSRSQVPQSVDVERGGKSDGRRGTVS